MNLRPANYISSSVYDWFLAYCIYHNKSEPSMYSGYKPESFTRRITENFQRFSQLKEQIRAKYLKPTDVMNEKNLFAFDNNPYIMSNYFHLIEREEISTSVLWSARKDYLIGKTLGYSLLKKSIIDEEDDGSQLKVEVHSIRLAVKESLPNGHNNFVFPNSMILSDLSVNTFNQGNNPLSDFFVADMRNLAEEKMNITAIFSDDEDAKNAETNPKADKPKPKRYYVADDSRFTCVDYLIRISVTNNMSYGYFLNFIISGGNGENFDNCEIMMPLRGMKSDYLIHTICLKNINQSFKGLSIKVGHRRSHMANMRHYTEDVIEEMVEILNITDK